MFKTVLFDLDGTLLNTIDDLADSANRVCKAHGWPEHDTAQYKYFVGNGIPKLVERFSPEDQRDPETLQKTLAEFDTVYGAHMHDKPPVPRYAELLAKLQKNGVKMAFSQIKPMNSPAPWWHGTSTAACLRSCAAHCPMCPPNPHPRAPAP